MFPLPFFQFFSDHSLLTQICERAEVDSKKKKRAFSKSLDHAAAGLRPQEQEQGRSTNTLHLILLLWRKKATER